MSQEPDKTPFNMVDAIKFDCAVTWEAVRYQFKLGSTKGTWVTLKNSALKRLLCDTQEMLTRSTIEEHHEDTQSGLLESMNVWSEVLKAASSDTIHKFTQPKSRSGVSVLTASMEIRNACRWLGT